MNAGSTLLVWEGNLNNIFHVLFNYANLRCLNSLRPCSLVGCNENTGICFLGDRDADREITMNVGSISVTIYESK